MNDGKFQHSSTEIPSRVAIEVKFRDGVVALERMRGGQFEGSGNVRLVAKWGMDATSRSCKRVFILLKR